MAVDVSKIPNNSKFDPVREAILKLQKDVQEGVAGVATVNSSDGNITITKSGNITVDTVGETITIGINDSDYLSLSDAGTQTIAGNIIINGDLEVVGDITGSIEEARTVRIVVKNTETTTLAKGTVVHVHPSANPPSGNVVEVKKADYDTASLMPAIGILNESLAAGAEGRATMFGFLKGINTSSFSAGDELYVGNDGALTNTKPTGATQLIQKIAVVIKSHASNGSIEIFGAGRSNDVPNLNVTNASTAGNVLTLNRANATDVVYDPSFMPLSGGVFTGNVRFNDNVELRIGTGNDLLLYHDGSNSYIKDNGTGSLIIEGTTSTQIKGSTFVILRSTEGENMLVGNANGSVDLFYNASKKFETTSTGAKVSGDLEVTGDLTISGTTTFIDTTHLNIGDNIITLNADLPSNTAPTENAGIEINRGSSADKTFLWNETSDKWTLGSETLVAGTFEGNLTGNADTATNADKLDGYHASAFALAGHNHDDRYYTETESDARFTKYVNLTNQVQLSNYSKSVIALCNADNSDVDRNSYSIGTLTFHRTNGLNAPVKLDIAIEKRYNANGTNVVALAIGGDSFADNIQYVTFEKDNVVYGGIEFYFTAAQHHEVTFYGRSNFDIFGLDYYDDNASPQILNQEVYDSISTTNVSLETDFFFNNNKVWHEGNDGSGSGLDADKVDGKHATDFTLDYVTDNGNSTTNSIIVGGINANNVSATSGDFEDLFLTNASGSSLIFRNSQGNTADADNLATMSFQGYYGTAFVGASRIQVKANEDFSSTARGTVINFDFWDTGSTYNTVASIDSDGFYIGTTNVYDNLPDGISWSDTDNRLKIGVSKNVGGTTETAIQPILLANLLTEGYVPYVATGGAGTATVNSKVSNSWLKLTTNTLELGASDPISHEIKYARFLWQSGANDKISTVYGARDITASIQYLGGSKTAKIEFTTGSGGGRIQFNDEYTFPAADGTSGQVLTTNGSGDLSWADASGGGSLNLQDVTTNGATSDRDISFTKSSGTTYTPLTLALTTSGASYVKQDFITDTLAASTAYIIAYGSGNAQDGSLAIKNNSSHTTTNGTAGDIWFTTGANASDRMRIEGSTGNVRISEDLTVNGDFTAPTATIGGILLQDSADRAGLLEVNRKGTNTWAGIQVNYDDAHWSWMGNTDFAGLFDDKNGKWAFLYGTNNNLDLYYNGTVQARTQNGYFLALNEFRSEVFRGTNTAYHVTPAGTSNLSVLDVERINSINASDTPDIIGDIPIIRRHDGTDDYLTSIDNLDTFILSKKDSLYGGGTKPLGSHNGTGIISLQTHSGNYYTQLALDTKQNGLWIRSANATTTFGSWQRTFADDYHPNADKWTTARTLTLNGDASGSVSWDGSSNATLTVTVANDSHSHSNYVTTTGDDLRTGSLRLYSTDTNGSYNNAAIELKEVNEVGTAQSAYQYAPAIAWHWGGRKQMQMRLHSDGHLYVDGSNYGQSKVWTAGNDGSGSGLDADTVDGLQANQFLRSDVSDVMTGRLQIDPSGTQAMLLGRHGGIPTIQANTDDGGHLMMDSNGGVVGLNWYNSNNVVLAQGGGNVGIGNSPAPQKLTVHGDMSATIYYDRDNTNYYWDPNTSGAHRLQTPSGYLDLAPMNSSWCHFQTDRGNFYFNKGIAVDGQIRGYDSSDTARFVTYYGWDTNYYVSPQNSSRINNLEVTGGLTLPEKGFNVGSNDYHMWKRHYVVNSTTPAELLDPDGNSLPNGGNYRFTAHISGTGTDQFARAVFWNQNGTWRVNVTGQSGTSSNHPEFIIASNGTANVPHLHIDHATNYTIHVLGERMELDEGTGTDNAGYGFGVDGFMGSVGGNLYFTPDGTSATGQNPYDDGNLVFHTGHLPTWNEVSGKPTTFTPSSHTHDASDITSGTLSGDRLPWANNDGFTGTYPLVWKASNTPYTASWLNVNGTTDTLNTKGIYASGQIESTSSITAGGSITTGTDFWGKAVNGQWSNIYRIGGIYFTWDSDSYGTNFNHSITSTNNGVYGDNITINSYGNVRINIDTNNNGANTFAVGKHTTGTGNELLTLNESGDMVLAGTVAATHVYVSGTIYHRDDTNTYISMVAADDMQLVCGGRQMLRMDEGTDPDKLRFTTDNSWTNSAGEWRFHSRVGINIDPSSTAPNNAKLLIQGGSYGDRCFHFIGNGFSSVGSVEMPANNSGISFVNNGASGQSALAFVYGSSNVGRIAINSTSTSYVTTSDYRLKENLVPITDGIDRLKLLQPKRFNFIGSENVVDGFVAHEAQEVVPEAVTGEKDGIDWEGKPDYQGIDQAKLVPLLTAALQEAISKIESLEARVAQLESNP